MPQNLDNIELRSQEVQEILSKPPSWMIRWGNILFFVLIFGLLLLSLFIKYPSTITIPSVLTASPDPSTYFAPFQGNLVDILAEENTRVENGQAIMVLESAAQYTDVFQVKEMLDSIAESRFSIPIGPVSSNWKLGSLTPSFEAFKDAYENHLSLENTPYQSNDELSDSFNNITTAIAQWDQQHVIRARTGGFIHFSSSNYSKQVSVGDPVFTIVPNPDSSILARLKVPSTQIHKVRQGQKVQISIDSYPDEEFGQLIGQVQEVPKIPDADGNFVVIAEVPELTTTMDQQIPFTQLLPGKSEIIIENERLFNRFFFRVKKKYSGQ